METKTVLFKTAKEEATDSYRIEASSGESTPYMFSKSFSDTLCEKFNRLSLSPCHLADVICDYVRQYTELTR